MKLKKLLQGTMFAAAMAICMTAGVITAEAADNDGSTGGADVGAIAITANGEMTVAKGSGQEVMVGIAKVDKKNNVKVASWDVYDGAATIDLSKLSNVKDNYIALKSEKMTVPAVIKIPATDKAIKAELDAKTSTIKVGVGATAAAAKATKDLEADTYEYRTAYSNWTALWTTGKTSIDMSKYTKQGATIYVRAKGVAQASVSTQSTDTKDEFTYNGSETKYKMYVATAKLPGKEAKVNIKAMAKGPAVAADYAKGTVTLPKASEYRLVTSSIPTSNTPNTDKAVKKVADIIGSNESASLEVRTAATDKKAASKWTSVALVKAKALAAGTDITVGETPTAAPSDKNEPGKVDEGTKVEYGGGGLSAAKVKEDSKDVWTVTYEKKGKKDVIIIDNTAGKKTYEIVAQTTETAPAADAKAIKIAAGKKVTVPNVADNAFIYIRVAGDKKTQTWVGEYAKLGKVDYPKTIVGTKPKTTT